MNSLLRLLIVLVAWAPALSANDEKNLLHICTDVNFWAPYTLVVDSKPAGIHVQIAERVLKQLDINFQISAWPWNRCINGARAGYYDAVVSASYTEERAQDFYYPPDAAQAAQSAWRVTQAEYMVVVRSPDYFDWNGDNKVLPMPIGLPLGYALVNSFREDGLEVMTATKYSNLFNMLDRGRINSLVVLRQTAEMYISEERFAGRLMFLKLPQRSKSYFLLASKRGKINEVTAQKIWQGIAVVREDKAQMAEISAAVKDQLERCFELLDLCKY